MGLEVVPLKLESPLKLRLALRIKVTLPVNGDL